MRVGIARSFSLCLGLLVAAAGMVWACGGTSVPVCGRSIWLAKFAPRVVVFPRGARPIRVPIGVLPFVSWNPNPVCPQPSSASLTLTLNCVPSGITIGPVTIPLPTPTVPGPQPLPGPVIFTIPAGTFPPGTPPQVCTVVGTYTVNFAGAGAISSISATGDTEVCIVDPSPLHPKVPRLDVRFLDIDGGLFQTCRKGDQAVFYLLIANNDPTNAVTLDLESEGKQVARLPDGFTTANAYANNVFAISKPTPGTDTPMAAFCDELKCGELIAETDPDAVDAHRLTRVLTIPPLDSLIIVVCMRSHGMCANGSCGERFVKVQGTFADKTPALGCAGTALLVGDVPGKSPLCEFTDSIKVGPLKQAIYSMAQFFDEAGTLRHSSTFFAGNLADGGFKLTGAKLQNPAGENFPPTARDNVRMTARPDFVQYDVVCLPAMQTQTVLNQVGIQGLGTIPNSGRFELPLIQPDPFRQSFFDIFVDLSPPKGPDLRVFDVSNEQILYQGPLQPFLEDPPQGLAVDSQTCRAFQKSDLLGRPVIWPEPLFLSRLLRTREVRRTMDLVEVMLEPPVPGAMWEASIQGRGARLPVGMGPIATPIDVRYDVRGTQPVPRTNVARLRIEVDDALNSPFDMPVALRRK